ncbi:MAG: protein kinase [Planctomycetes bacterium]|nr:protein kinase [Planctomycetota bacterium]
MAKSRKRKVSIPEVGSTFVQSEDSSYTILGELRRGGMGTILLARDHELDRDVAMKLLLNEKDDLETRRFQLEAKLTGFLEHPNIVPIHSMGHDEDLQRSFFTMKLIHGEDLRELLQGIKKDKKGSQEWTLTKLLHIFVAVSHAIEFAHSKRIIHRDLKPSNIMVGDFGEVQVMDWGIAKCLDSEESDSIPTIKRTQEDIESDDQQDEERTMDGDIVGTINYMPPEQALGILKDVDERSDVYSLGAILYEIQTLWPPVSGKSVTERLEKVEKNKIVMPQVMAPRRKIPKELEAITMKALSSRAEDRYQTAADLRKDIEYFLENRAVSAYDASVIEVVKKLIQRNVSASIAIGASLAVIILIFVVSYFMLVDERATAVQEWLRAERSLDQFQKEQHQRELAEQAQFELNNQIKQDAERSWTLIHEDEFRSGAGAWEILGDCQWEIVDQELHVYGGEPQIVLFNRPLTGDLKIEFDCRFEGHYLNDASCFISSYWDEDPDIMAKSGYYFGYGSHDNKQVTLLRGDESLYRHLDEPLQENVNYHVEASRIGDHLLMLINGEKVIDVHDPSPLSGSSRNRLGIFGYKSHVFYDNVKIYGLGQSKKVDVLDLADYYMTNGEYKTAQLLYENVTQTAAELKRLQRARRGVQAAADYGRKLALMGSYKRQIRRAFRGGEPRISLTDIGLEIDASHLEVVDLQKLVGLPINYIDLSSTSVSDIRPLSSMALRYIDVSGTQVSDIRPLEGMDLYYIDLEGAPVSDISVLRTMKLEYINLHGTEVRDVSVLTGMPLSVLIAPTATVEDPQIFTDMPLLELEISGKHIRDISFLKGKKLTRLALINTAVSDYSLLKEMSSLRRLKLVGSPVDDISFIRGMHIFDLGISGTLVKDFTPLKDVQLRKLFASNTAFSDLDMIKHMPLELLELNYTNIDDISVLQEMPSMKMLYVLGTKVHNISALKFLKKIETVAINPHNLDAGWESILKGLSSVDKVIGVLEEMTVETQSVIEFIANYKSGKYKK